jgi:sulfite exporter TauE/SafE
MDWLIAALTPICGAEQAARGIWLLPALLLAGLSGSVVHCAGMCGPFVLGQAADRMARLPAGRMCESARLRSGLLLPYHAGRIATYTALGTAAGVLGAARMPPAVPALLLTLAAAAFLLLALGRAQPRLVAGLAPALAGGGGLFALAGPAGRLGGLPLGLALGFLPCGMVYAALAAAASAGPVMGGAAMLAFGLGTVPGLVAVAVLGQAAARRWQGATRAFAPWLLGANGLLLLALAWRTMAPGP